MVLPVGLQLKLYGEATLLVGNIQPRKTRHKTRPTKCSPSTVWGRYLSENTVSKLHDDACSFRPNARACRTVQPNKRRATLYENIVPRDPSPRTRQTWPAETIGEGKCHEQKPTVCTHPREGGFIRNNHAPVRGVLRSAAKRVAV